MGPWNIEAPRNKPTLQILLYTLLGMKAHRIERAFLFTDGEGMFCVSQIVLRLPG
jgi:hypothetical protein